MDRNALDPLHPLLPRWEPIEIKLLNARNDGTEFWDEINIVPVSNRDGCYTRWVSVQRDAGHPAMAEAAPVRAPAAEVPPDHPASHDGLTRLHDRDYLMDRLNDVLGRSRSNTDLRCVVLLIELEWFKRVDDGHAPHAQDVLLTEQIRRLRTSTRARDTLAQIGDGEFVLLIEELGEPTFVAAVANRIIERMGRPLRFRNQEIQSSCSIGVVHATEHRAAWHRSNGYRDCAEAMVLDARNILQQARREGIGSHPIPGGSTSGDQVLK